MSFRTLLPWLCVIAAVALFAKSPPDPWRGAAVYVDAEWRVARPEEKPPRGTSTTGWNNAGIMAFAPLALDYARRLAPSARGEYELPQAIAHMVRDGHVVRAVPVRGPWSDVGTPDDLAAAQDLFAMNPGGAT
jgi:dTDP-glucose pyrophosphorylase